VYQVSVTSTPSGGGTHMPTSSIIVKTTP
jgi:hypothetical protein